jgi:hypothetical protein
MRSMRGGFIFRCDEPVRDEREDVSNSIAAAVFRYTGSENKLWSDPASQVQTSFSIIGYCQNRYSVTQSLSHRDRDRGQYCCCVCSEAACELTRGGES